MCIAELTPIRHIVLLIALPCNNSGQMSLQSPGRRCSDRAKTSTAGSGAPVSCPVSTPVPVYRWCSARNIIAPPTAAMPSGRITLVSRSALLHTQCGPRQGGAETREARSMPTHCVATLVQATVRSRCTHLPVRCTKPFCACRVCHQLCFSCGQGKRCASAQLW